MDGLEEYKLEAKKQDVIKLGVRVFGGFIPFSSWLVNPRNQELYKTYWGLVELEEKLIQLDEGYCL